MTGEILSLNLVAISYVIYWSFRSSSKMRGDGAKGGKGVNRYFSTFHFTRENENCEHDLSPLLLFYF